MTRRGYEAWRVRSVESTKRGSAYAKRCAARADGAVAADDRLNKRAEIAATDRIEKCGGGAEGSGEGFGGGAEFCLMRSVGGEQHR